MTREEIINMRETLVAEQRKLRQAIKILQSDSIVMTPGIQHTVVEYNDRIKEIDAEIKKLAEEYRTMEHKENEKTEPSEWTIEFDFEGEKVYPTTCLLRFQYHPSSENVLTWNDMDEAKAFARWYSGKYGFKIIPADHIK